MPGTVDTTNEHSMERNDTLIVVATYNEIENLPELVDKLLAILPAADLLVIDDGSPDGTGEWCDERCKTESRLQVIHRAGKLGLGSATVEGFNFGIQHGYKVLATMDADFSHSPDELPQLIDAVRSENRAIDVAIGSRYTNGGKIVGWPITRRVMSRCVNLYARICLGLKVKDCSGAFRAYRVACLSELPPRSIQSQGYSYLEEILWRLKRKGSSIGELPITFRDRTRGQTKINWREAVAALYHIFRFGVRNWLRLGD